MNAKEVIANGTLVGHTTYGTARLFAYKGSVWAVFRSDNRFAYCWGNVGQMNTPGFMKPLRT